jgi:hypothetical protein
MGRQINFYMAPEDHFEFVSYLSSDATILMVTDRSSDHVPKIIRTPERELASNAYSKKILLRAQDLAVIRMRQVSDADWRVDTLRSPVVEFSPCRMAGGVIQRGRLFFDPAFFAANGQLSKKDPHFIRWAHAQIEWIRRHLTYTPALGAYIGQKAKSLVKSSSIVLRAL